MKDDNHFCEAPLSPARQAWLMLVVIAPMAACYPAIKAGLEFAPSLRFAGLRTLVGGLALLIVLVLRRKRLWPEARLARWILPLAGTALSTWLWFWLLQRTEAGRLSLYLFLVPVFGLLIAMGGFGERLNALQGGGVTLILLAVALSVFAGRSGPVPRSAQARGKPSSEPQRPETHRPRNDLGTEKKRKGKEKGSVKKY